jgi:acyl-CoA synthetase
MVAAVAMPDPVYGERVCVFVVPREGMTVDVETLGEHLRARGVSPETWPERVELVDDLPRGSGGKVAKVELRRRLSSTV